MSKTSKAGAVIAFTGAMIFFFGVYILPFGTDFWMYIWVEKVFNGNWFYGDIAANLAAIFLIIIGAALMVKEHRSPIPRQRKKKSKKKKSKKAKIEDEVMYL